MGTSATVRLIEGVRLIQVSLYVKVAISHTQGSHPIGIRVSVEVNHIRCEVVPDGEQVGMKCTGETESAVNIVGLVVPPVLNF